MKMQKTKYKVTHFLPRTKESFTGTLEELFSKVAMEIKRCREFCEIDLPLKSVIGLVSALNKGYSAMGRHFDLWTYEKIPAKAES